MHALHTGTAGASRLRFVFGDAVVHLGLASNATFGDVASALGDLAPKYPGASIAVTVILPPMPEASVSLDLFPNPFRPAASPDG